MLQFRIEKRHVPSNTYSIILYGSYLYTKNYNDIDILYVVKSDSLYTGTLTDYKKMEKVFISRKYIHLVPISSKEILRGSFVSLLDTQLVQDSGFRIIYPNEIKIRKRIKNSIIQNYNRKLKEEIITRFNKASLSVLFGLYLLGSQLNTARRLVLKALEAKDTTFLTFLKKQIIDNNLLRGFLLVKDGKVGKNMKQNAIESLESLGMHNIDKLLWLMEIKNSSSKKIEYEEWLKIFSLNKQIVEEVCEIVDKYLYEIFNHP